MPKAKSYQHEPLWPQLKSLAESGSKDAANEILAKLSSGEDIYEVLALHRFALRFFTFRPWHNKNLDLIAAIGNSGVTTALEAAEDLEDDATWLRDEASQLAYNCASSLAPCWRDGFERETPHLQAGLNLATLATKLRQDLKKNSMSLGLAWLLKGTHELALGKANDGGISVAKALVYIEEAGRRKGAKLEVCAEAPYEFLLAKAYAAMAKALASTPETKNSIQDIQSILDCFTKMRALGPASLEAAELAIEQIGQMRDHLGLVQR